MTATGTLEHVNLTVSDPRRTADMLCDLFGWRVRWDGKAMSGGHTFHVGKGDSYVAIYRIAPGQASAERPKVQTIGRLNHLGIVVEDLAAAERHIVAAGYVPFNHGDYEPGRRFYFLDGDGIEYEIVSYA